MSPINTTRHAAFEALSATLDDLIGKPGITEKMFHSEWYRRLSDFPDVFADGWYAPPPHGMSVLTGKRTSFQSMRDPEFWPSSQIINWQNDLFHVYASPVGKSNGVPGDIAMTLYFGPSPTIKGHFKKTHEVMSEIFAALEAGLYQNSFDLVFAANAAFAKAGYRNMVFSVTDPASINLGHTFPAIKIDPAQTALSDAQKDHIRMSRLYLNSVTKWPFAEDLQFTFEPQLVPLHDPASAKMSYHYLVQGGAKPVVCRAIDGLLKRFDLIP
jgi:hypothetical protein